MNRLSVTIKDRTVYWDLKESLLAQMLSPFVQMLGPAQEEE